MSIIIVIVVIVFAIATIIDNNGNHNHSINVTDRANDNGIRWFGRACEVLGTPVERKRWFKSRFYARLPLSIRSWLYFSYRYYVLFGFLDGPEGRIFHFLQAYWYRFLVDAKLFEAAKYPRIKDELVDEIYNQVSHLDVQN